MEIDRLKLELLEKIINCDDAATLQRVEEVFIEFSEVNEEEEKYLKEVDPVPDIHYQKLEEEFEKYKNGELKGISWEKFRKEIKSNYGF
jgi:hypothetical protein